MARDRVELVKRAVDGFNRRDVDVFFAELATEDFEWFPGLVRALHGSGYRGREGVEQVYADIRDNWETLETVAEEFRDLGDRVVMFGRLVGRGRTSGAEVDAPVVGISDFHGERIGRVRVYLDRAEGLRAAGLSE